MLHLDQIRRDQPHEFEVPLMDTENNVVGVLKGTSVFTVGPQQPEFSPISYGFFFFFFFFFSFFLFFFSFFFFSFLFFSLLSLFPSFPFPSLN